MRIRAFLPLVFALVACAAPMPQQPASGAQKSPTPKSIPLPDGMTVTTYASGLVHPWGMAFLPDGRLLVTERPGRLRIVDRNGQLSAPIAGVPRVASAGQGGLLDVTVAPDFAKSRTIYFSFAEPGDGGSASTAVARAQLGEGRLENVKVIYSQQPKVVSAGHFGSRVVIAPDGRLFITQGERMKFRDQAQDLASGLGKIMRINPDGSIPEDNPFAGHRFTRPEIWSYGHRNLQGAAIDPATGRLWTVEHGARGGDELNHPEAGKNYGWPVITYGVDYGGGKIGEGTAKEGMEQPVYFWDPVIAPSGLLFYTGDAYPQWKGSVFIGSLTPGLLTRLTMKDGKVTSEERYLESLDERIRDVEQGPDGLIYLATDNEDGRVLRIERGKGK